MDFNNKYQEFKENLERFSQLNAATEDIASSNSREFYEHWGNAPITVPGAFVNWEVIEATLIRQAPELFGNWSTHLVVTDEIRALIGELTDPVIEYINLSRKTMLNQRLKVLESEGYIELVFDMETGFATYTIAEKGKEHEANIAEMIEANGRF